MGLNTELRRVKRRIVLKSIGVGATGIGLSDSAAASGGNSDGKERKVPDVFISNHSGESRTFDVEITRQTGSGSETIFEERVTVQADESRRFKKVFSNSGGHRATATVDDGQSESEDVTIVANNKWRYSAVMKISSAGGLFLGFGHIDIPTEVKPNG